MEERSVRMVCCVVVIDFIHPNDFEVYLLLDFIGT